MDEPKKKPNKGLKILLIAVGTLLLVGIVVGIVWIKFRGAIVSKFLSLFLSKTAGQDVKVGNDGKKITFDGNGGQFSYSAEGELPDEFPKDFPIYTGAKLTSSWTTDGESGKGVSVVWETTDSADKVQAFYKDKLPKSGWKIDNEFAQESMQTISFEKDNISGFIGLTKAEQKLTISATFGIK